MKLLIKNYSLVVCALSLLLVGPGCKQESNTPASGGEAAPANSAAIETDLKNTAEALKQDMQKQAAAVQQSAKEATDQVKAAADQATAEAQSVIDKAKAMVQSKQYKDALNLLQQLRDVKLTPEQQKLVADLKTQVQSFMTNVGATNVSGLGGLLGK